MREKIYILIITGFIDNGFYFRLFEELIVGFKAGIQGLEYQRMNVDTKKITVLSGNYALRTSNGDNSGKVSVGRILRG